MPTWTFAATHEGTPHTGRRRMAIEGRPSVARTGSHNQQLRLRLYVAGRAPNSVRAIANCRAICDEHFAAAYDLEIVDLLEHPTRAMADGIIVTPTLMKLLPLPVQRVIGSLSDANHVLMVLSSR